MCPGIISHRNPVICKEAKNLCYEDGELLDTYAHFSGCMTGRPCYALLERIYKYVRAMMMMLRYVGLRTTS